jgi:[glutamine synthetase] adenylyltransferase / [glutamine synthetase]-adenylyl-L-tyrosine phosphorylase
MTRPDAVLDAPGVARALDRSADPRAARAALSRILEAHPELGPELRDERAVRDAIIAIVCASRPLAAALTQDATLVEPLRDAADFSAERSVAAFHASADSAAIGDPDALRHWKRREYLRIAARDLLRVADLPTVGRELSALAGVCLETALTLADPDGPIAVIAMGKLGGRELNYASDVDVLFVHDGDQEGADHVARRVLSLMAAPTPAGIVFRTDAELRPEGRSGTLTRSLDAYPSPATPRSAPGSWR